MRNKKILLAVIFLLFSLLPAYAQYDSEKDFETKLSEDGESVWIIKYLGKNQDVNIPPKIKGLPVSRIDNSAFAKLWNIKNVKIPDSVTSIGHWAFYGCYLTSVNIPDSVISIENQAFYNWTLIEINVGSGNTAYSSEDGVLYDKNKTTLIQFPTGNNITSFSIPNSVINIKRYAFYKSYNLELVDIPDSVTSIGESAFFGSELKSLNIPNSVISIGDRAFGYCSELTSVTIGNSVESIGAYVFDHCSKLTNVTIGNSVESIGHRAFSHSGLISVKIPNSVTRIGWNAFSNCLSLTSVTIPDSIIRIEGEAFLICFELTSVTFEGPISKEIIYYKDIYYKNDEYDEDNESYEYDKHDEDEIYEVNERIFRDAFLGDLRKKFYEENAMNGTPGTYTTTAPVDNRSKWTRQP
jgi:hypothetical protein